MHGRLGSSLAIALCVACTSPRQESMESTLESKPVPTPPIPTSTAAIVHAPAQIREAAAPAHLRLVRGVEVRRVGPERMGFIDWLSANGRFVSIYHFEVEPRFTPHGGVHDGQPTLTLYDTATGHGEEVEEIIAVDPRGRHFVVLTDPHLWLIDSETGQRDDLAQRGADLAGDESRCVHPRQAVFNVHGTHILYLRTDPDRAVIRDLADGSESEIAAHGGRLWRAEPMGLRGYTQLYLLAADTDGDGAIEPPIMGTTCACRWCRRFGTYSNSGWIGDAFQIVQVSPNGRRIPLASALVPITADIFGDEDGALQRADGGPVTLPDGCVNAQILDGADGVLLTCSDRGRLWWPARSRSVELPGSATALTRVLPGAPGSQGVLGVSLKAGDQQRLAAIDLALGLVSLGPEVIEGHADRNGRIFARTADSVVVFEPSTGTTWRYAAVAERVVPGAALVAGRWFAIEGEHGLIHALPAEPSALLENGCALIPAGGIGRRLDTGPWILRCVAPKPARPR